MTAWVLLAAAAAASAQVPFAVGFLDGRTVLAGLAFDARGKLALELVDSARRSSSSTLIAVQSRGGALRDRAPAPVRLAGRDYTVSISSGVLVIAGGPKGPELRVPAERLFLDARERLARECAPLSEGSRWCFRLAPAGGGAVNVWRLSEVLDFTYPAAPGTSLPAAPGPGLAAPVKTIRFQGGKPKTVEIGGAAYRFTPTATGVGVESLAQESR